MSNVFLTRQNKIQSYNILIFVFLVLALLCWPTLQRLQNSQLLDNIL
jgi:hypothetical protein